MSQTTQTKKANPKLMLFLLLVVFGGPFLFAWTLYQKADTVEFSTMNKGDLIIPAIEASQLSLNFSDGNPVQDELKGFWTLAYHMPKVCTKECHQNVHNMRQMHISLNQDAERLQRLHMFRGDQESVMNLIKESYPKALSTQIEHSKYVSVLGDKFDGDDDEVGSFYVIDPLGHVMMHYSGDMPIKAVRTDLKRLLKLSKVG